MALSDIIADESDKADGDSEVFRLRPFDAQPQLRYLADKAWGSAVVALAAPIIVVLLLVVAAFTGRLTVPDWPGIIADDWQSLIGTGTDITEPEFPLARDSVSLLVSFLQVANLWLILRQWRAIRDFTPDLVKSGSLTPKKVFTQAGMESEVKPAESEEKIADAPALYATTNAVFRWVGLWTIFTLPLAFFAAWQLYNNFTSESIFDVFAPNGLSPDQQIAWSSNAYESWWASPSNPAGQWAFLLVATFIVYFILLQNAVGLILSLLVWRVRNSFEYRGDPLNTDGSFGWSPAGRVLKTVYQSLSVNSACLLLVYILFNGRKPGGLWPFTILLLVAGSIYVIVPVWVMNRGLSSFRVSAAELIRIESTRNLSQLESGGAEWLVLRNAARAEIESVRRLSAFPWRGRIVPLLGFNLVVFVAALAQVFQYLLSGR